MTRRLATAVLAAFLLYPLGAAAQDCDRASDMEASFEVDCESEDITVVRKPGGRVATAMLQARKKEGEKTVSVILITVSTTRNFEDTDTAHLVADGTELEVSLQPTGDTERMGAAKELTFEVKRLALSQPEARQISQADTVRMETEGATFRLGPLPGQVREVLRLSGQQR